jgi:hypothetical protein
MVPIGLANSMWLSNYITFFQDSNFMKNLNKTKKTYFNFTVTTNTNKRQVCYDSLINKLTWLDNVSAIENIFRLKEYEFCICPEGNGVDTHRLWEALYLKTVPVVIKSEFTNILLKNNVPVVVLDNWSDYDENNYNYNDYLLKFNDPLFKQISNFNNNYVI